MPQNADTMSEEELIERGRAAVEVRERQELRRMAAQRALAEKIESEGGEEKFDIEAYGREWRDQREERDNDKSGGGSKSSGKSSRSGDDEDTKVRIADDSDD